MANKRAIHPNGDTIVFNEKYHTYKSLLRPSVKFVSGTGFLKRFKPEFERDRIAARCAAKDGVSIDEIIESWEYKGFFARTVGTLVHQFCEDWLSPGVDHTFVNTIVHSNVEIQKAARIKAEVCIPMLAEIEDKYEVIALEEIIASCDLGIAGMIDLRCINRESGNVALLDYKTSKTINFNNRWGVMLEPLSHLDDANFNHYALQLALYEHIGLLEGYYSDSAGVERTIIHIRDDGHSFIPCPDLQSEIGQMLAA